MQDAKDLAEKISAHCSSIEEQRKQLAELKDGWTHNDLADGAIATKQVACTTAYVTYKDGCFELMFLGVQSETLKLSSAEEVLKLVKEVEEGLGLGGEKG